MQISRRNFLKVSTLASGGLMFSFYPFDNNISLKTFEPNLYIKISTENIITIRISKHEMGQGIHTSLAMLITEELEADFKSIKIESIPFSKNLQNYKQKFGLQDTGASDSILSQWNSLREAGAIVRELLLNAAAQTWNVSKTECHAENSFVIYKKSNKKLSYGQLIEVASSLELPKEVSLKPIKEHKLIGKPTIDVKNKFVVNGTCRYSIDMEVPNMVYAAITLYPTKDAEIITYDAPSVLEIPGVLDIVEFPGTPKDDAFTGSEPGIAVIADSTWAAFKGKQKLEEIIEWDLGEYGKKNIETLKNDFKKVLHDDFLRQNHQGNIDNAFNNKVTKELSVFYENPYLAHGLMEPLNAIANVTDNSCEIWAGSQSAQYTSYHLSKLLHIDMANFVFHTFPSGGGFGRRFFTDYVTQAAFISQKTGKPVKVTWTREDEIKHGRYHPFRQDHYRGGLDKNNNLIAVHRKGMTIHAWGAGVRMIYNIPNYKTEQITLDSILHFGSWRSVGEHNSILGRECFIDEMAHLAKKDPIVFRKELLENELNRIQHVKKENNKIKYKRKQIPRYLNVLNVLSKEVNWDAPLPENEGLGMAISDYGSARPANDWCCSVCGQVVHVSVKEGNWTIKKITVVVDCGTLINPSGARAQIEGGIHWALTPLIHEGVAIKNGQVVQSNFHDYKVLRINEAPEVDIHFVKSDYHPTGLGETSVPQTAPAVLNALFNATGKRIRKIPVIAENLTK